MGNAKRPIPIIAFHGTGDPINPYTGNGNPEYWYDSVPKAIDQWAKFNDCKRLETQELSPHVVAEKHTDCDGSADVVLVKIDNGGHTWPGSSFKFKVKDLGRTTHEINASILMGAFLSEHPFAMQTGGGNGGSILTVLIVTSMPLVAVTVLSCLLIRAKVRETDSETDSSSGDSSDGEC